MEVKVKINWDNDNLWCTDSKERIHIGEEYCLVKEELFGGTVIYKPYKKEYLPIDEDSYYEED